MEITVKASTTASIDTCWKAATTAEAIMAWNAATEDWHCPSATVDLKVGGTLRSRMESKDREMGFDFEATFTEIEGPTLLRYELGDGRKVKLELTQDGDQVTICQTFDAESENDPEMQRAGWQAILDNFVRYAEAQ